MSSLNSRRKLLRLGGGAAILVLVGACNATQTSDGLAEDTGSTDGSTTGLSTGDDGSLGADPSGTTGDVEGGDVDAGEGSEGDGDGDGDHGSGTAGAGGQEPGQDVPALAPTPQGTQPPEGQLTSGIYDDNLSFDFFKKYHDASIGRIADGRMPFSWDDHEAAHARATDAYRSRTALDIAVVFDTTGSMGDELDYLKDEFGSITEAVSSLYPNAEQRWSLVVYRDQGDQYVTRSQEFTADLQDFQSFLDAQSYDGGGDFPEAPEEGLAEANALSWSGDDDTAKLIFWVADAPHHNDKAQALAAAISQAQDQNIHIYPVASSGIDELTEFTMRQSAQLTWGRYLFLTDDSGLGGGHKEPTLPCYYVSTLRDAIVRSVQSEMSGARVAIEDDAVVRFSGRLNEEGSCFYGSGYEATPF
jgi:hypothetical protein